MRRISTIRKTRVIAGFGRRRAWNFVWAGQEQGELEGAPRRN
jgi:hypothetical protein